MNALLAALLAHPWAMDAVRFRAMIAELQAAVSLGSPAGLSAFFGSEANRGQPKLEVTNGVATIRIHGVMMKSIPAFLKAWGFGGCDIEDARKMLLEATFRDDVRAIVLDVDSPGGDVAGTKDLADEVFAARAKKPVTARASGELCSAAYWVASQAKRISATASTVVGSIGIVTSIVDSSAAAEGEGFKVHVIGSNALKGAGTPGAPVTDEQLAELRALVEKFAGMFTDDIARGRGMKRSEVNAIATGAVWVGADAKGAGLVDEIEKSKVQQKEKSMDIEKLQAELAAKIAECGGLTTEVQGLKAKIAELEALVKAGQATQRDMLLAKYEAHIAPANLAAVKQYGEYCGADMAKFEAHLKTLPPVTNPQRASNPGDVPPNQPQAELSQAALLVAKQWNNSPEDLRKVLPKAG